MGDNDAQNVVEIICTILVVFAGIAMHGQMFSLAFTLGLLALILTLWERRL